MPTKLPETARSCSYILFYVNIQPTKYTQRYNYVRSQPIRCALHAGSVP
nr:MAG TPA: hypothetical protein [Caudoviricetes sp.]